MSPRRAALIGVVFNGQASFGLNFTCEIETANKRAVIRGTITYHDDPSTLWLPKGIKLHRVRWIRCSSRTKPNCADAGHRHFRSPNLSSKACR